MSLESIVNKIAMYDRKAQDVLDWIREIKSRADEMYVLSGNLDGNEDKLRNSIISLEQEVKNFNRELVNYYAVKKQEEKLSQGDIAPDIKRKFMGLENSLSPENLSMDGEISQSQAKMRERQLINEWKVLERQVGRKVTEEEVSSWYR